MTTLVNIRHSKCDVIIDRTGPFGNPHRHGYCYICGRVHDRIDCVKAYKEDFYKKLLTDQEFRDSIDSLKDKVLGCWCVPKLCHGMIIIEYLEDIPCKFPTTERTEFFES